MSKNLHKKIHHRQTKPKALWQWTNSKLSREWLSFSFVSSVPPLYVWQLFSTITWPLDYELTAAPAHRTHTPTSRECWSASDIKHRHIRLFKSTRELRTHILWHFIIFPFIRESTSTRSLSIKTSHRKTIYFSLLKSLFSLFSPRCMKSRRYLNFSSSFLPCSAQQLSCERAESSYFRLLNNPTLSLT